MLDVTRNQKVNVQKLEFLHPQSLRGRGWSEPTRKLETECCIQGPDPGTGTEFVLMDMTALLLQHNYLKDFAWYTLNMPYFLFRRLQFLKIPLLSHYMQTRASVIKIMMIITYSGKQEAPHFSSRIIKHFPRDGSEHISRNKQQRHHHEPSAFLQVLMVINSIYR